jgi:hypothetical protein
VLRRGAVTVEHRDKIYTVRYDLMKSGVVRLETGQATPLGSLTAQAVARQLLRDIIESGAADREGLGRPKA